VTAVSPPQTPHKRGLRALLASVTVSSLGDGVFLAATPLAAALITRSPAAVAAVSVAEFLPWLLVTPVAGALVDRWPHRTVMIVADIARATMLGILALLVAADAASVPVLALAAAAVMIGTTFHDTASQTVVPALAGRDADELNRANGRISAANIASKELIGPPVGSIAFGLVPWLPFLADAVSFLGSAALLTALPREPRTRDSRTTESLMRSIRTGVTWLAHQRTLRAMCTLITVGNLAYSAALATFVLFAQDILGLEPLGFGLLLAAGAVGGIIGGFAASWAIRTIGDTGALLAAMLAQVAAFAGLVVTTNPWIAGLELGLASVGTAVATVVAISTRQRLTPPEMLGRVTAAFRTFGVGALPLGAAIGGTVASAWGLHAPFILAAAVLTAATLAWPLLSRGDMSVPGSPHAG